MTMDFHRYFPKSDHNSVMFINSNIKNEIKNDVEWQI